VHHLPSRFVRCKKGKRLGSARLLDANVGVHDGDNLKIAAPPLALVSMRDRKKCDPDLVSIDQPAGL